MRSVENEVRQIWIDLFANTSVGPDDDFFKLGGDSVMATMLMVGIEEKFGVQLDPIEVFERPVLHDFAAGLAEALSAAGEMASS